MVVVRSPLRISLGGGGTDLPSYYRNHGGLAIAAAIDKYVYITLHKTFTKEIILKYSKMEKVTAIAEIEHKIIRAALRYVDYPVYLEMMSAADIPAGTGLGSSSSFTTALLKGLYVLKKQQIHTHSLAEQACYLELDVLQEPIGKQDQYAAAYGGITCFEFLQNGQVEVTPVNIAEETLHKLEDNLLLFFTGYSRSASHVLQEQDKKSKQQDQTVLQNLHFVKTLGEQSKTALETGDMTAFAELMNLHWEYKRKRSHVISNPQIDAWYDLARANGACAGKLIGAGGGGFLMFYAADKEKLRTAMRQANLPEVRFHFDFLGTHVITQS